MLNIISWIVIILPMFFYPKTGSFFSSEAIILPTVFFACMELAVFFDLPIVKAFDWDQFSGQHLSLEKVFDENKDKIRKIRIIAFILFAIACSIIIVLTKPTTDVSIICSSYFLFILNINLDIAYALASADDRKLFWQEYITTRRVVTFIIFLCLFYAWMLYQII